MTQVPSEPTSARDVEAVLGQELVEREAGHAPRDLREARADLVGVAVAQAAQRAIDLGTPAAVANDAGERRVVGRADGHPRAVVGDDVERDDVVAGLAAHHRVHAAGVVADHPAQRVVRMRRRVRRERQVVALRGVAQVVEHDARLDARRPRDGIERDDAVQVFREVDDDRDVAALPGEARAAAAREHRRTSLAAGGQRLRHVVDRARNDDTDRHLAIVGAVGRVERAAAVVEADFAFEIDGEAAGEGVAVDVGRRRRARRGIVLHDGSGVVLHRA